MPHVSFVNSRRNASLHRTDCPCYTSRKTRDKSDNVQWTSPHQNIEGVILAVSDLRKDEILIPCKRCSTPEDERKMLGILARSRARR